MKYYKISDTELMGFLSSSEYTSILWSETKREVQDFLKDKTPLPEPDRDKVGLIIAELVSSGFDDKFFGDKKKFAINLLSKLSPLNRQTVTDIMGNIELTEYEIVTKILSLIPTPIEPSDDAKDIIVKELKKAQRGYGPVLDMVDDRELGLIADDLLVKLNIPEIEEVIGEYQAALMLLNKTNAEKVKLQHQLDDISQPKQLSRGEIWDILNCMARQMATLQARAMTSEPMSGEELTKRNVKLEDEATDSILALMPKPFNEAEIREIVVKLLNPYNEYDMYHAIKELSTLTHKDNIKEYYDE